MSVTGYRRPAQTRVPSVADLPFFVAAPNVATRDARSIVLALLIPLRSR